ncbi:MAG: hypothetical protein QOK37_3157 [Thermoanaerobaculia bacterium]|nr:hypothetical protein [Thermoanaerobaculia bacterium]
MTFAGRDAEFADAYQRAIAADADASLPFLRERYREGIRWRNVLDGLLPSSSSALRVLDAGSGNGAVALAMTATGRHVAVGADLLLNDTARRLFRGTSAYAIAASGAALPFANDTFDAVLCLETIEHIPTDGLHHFANELTRVLRPGGIILLTTPPRLRFLVARDPHFGIRGLLLMPPAMQRRIAAKRGFGESYHYVGRIFTSSAAIARLFPACTMEVLSRSRAPKRIAWDALVLKKKAPLRTAALS